MPYILRETNMLDTTFFVLCPVCATDCSARVQLVRSNQTAQVLQMLRGLLSQVADGTASDGGGEGDFGGLIGAPRRLLGAAARGADGYDAVTRMRMENARGTAQTAKHHVRRRPPSPGPDAVAADAVAPTAESPDAAVAVAPTAESPDAADAATNFDHGAVPRLVWRNPLCRFLTIAMRHVQGLSNIQCKLLGPLFTHYQPRRQQQTCEQFLRTLPRNSPVASSSSSALFACVTLPALPPPPSPERHNPSFNAYILYFPKKHFTPNAAPSCLPLPPPPPQMRSCP